jgi:23S rRNA-/tRNA-specific pseudouridylate synthase
MDLRSISARLHPRVAVVSQDANGLIALAKGRGVLSHPNGPRVNRSAILSLPYDGTGRCYRSEDGPVFLLNRLDSCTAGLLLITGDRRVATAVRHSFRRRRVKKIYHAFVFGRGNFHRRRWSDSLSRRRERDVLRVGAGGPLTAETDAFFLETFPSPAGPISLLRLMPITGRTHQLRFQCALHRLPIVGDRSYGDFPKNRALRGRGGDILQLHASEISLEYALDGRSENFSAAAPDLGEFLDGLRPRP